MASILSLNSHRAHPSESAGDRDSGPTEHQLGQGALAQTGRGPPDGNRGWGSVPVPGKANRGRGSRWGWGSVRLGVPDSGTNRGTGSVRAASPFPDRSGTVPGTVPDCRRVPSSRTLILFKFTSRWLNELMPDPEIPGPPNRDPDSRFPAKSGIGDFPIPRPNRESGIPSPIPGKKSGIGADSGDPIPDYRVSPSINRSGLGIYSAASIMPVLSQAACGSYSGSKDGACCCE